MWLGARNTLRMEKGMLLSGTDFDDNRDPYECSISFIVNNDGDFIGKDALMKRKSADTEIFRGGFVCEGGREIPRDGQKVYHDGAEVGIVTSGSISPILGKGIALGFIKRELSKPGTRVTIDVRGKMAEARVSRPKIVP